MSANDQQALKRQTDRFIKDDPTTLVLTRNMRVSDGAGGYTTTPTDLDPQVVKVVQTFPRATERRNQAGQVVTPSIYLVMYHDANVQNGDTFLWRGLDAEVVWITELDYVKHAEVAFA
jgi:hypothetical protein